MHRATIELDPRNLASVRVAKKLGMRREAHFVEACRPKGEWVDSDVFAILDREWAKTSGRCVPRDTLDV